MSTLPRFLIAATVSSFLLVSAGCGGSEETSSEAAGHITRAETYSDQGQYRSAMLEVKNAVQKDPGNIEHILTLARIYNEIGAGKPASELLTPWMEDHSDQVALPLARAYLQQGKHLSARETLEQVSPNSDQGQLEKQILLAESKRIGGGTDAAINDYRTILDRHPEHEEATTGLARALLAANEPSAALDLMQGWTERNGNNPKILYFTGLAHYRLGEVEETTAVLTDATATIPTSDVFLPVRRNILTLLSRSLTEQGRITEAQVYNKVLAENSSSASRERAESAIDAITRGDLDTARTTLEELVSQNPDNEQAALMLGALNLQEGRRDEAESLLVENVDAETTPTPFIRAATMAQLDSGKREEALATLIRAVEARPKDAELLGMHGLLALSLPEHRDAGVASLSKALELDRSRSRLRLALARYYMDQGQQEQALGQMRVAFSETPTDWSVTQNYLAFLLNTGKSKEAGEVKDSLINGFADEPRALTLAALTEYRLGDTAAAQSRLEKQIENSPDNVTALTALASIYRGEEDYEMAANTLLKAAQARPDSVRLLQNAGRMYGREHTPDEVTTWLQEVGSKHPSLAPNSTALAAQIRVQQDQLTEARSLLDGLPEESQNDMTKAVRGQLLVAEAEQATNQENWAKARSRAAEAVALQPGNLRFALVPVGISAMEGKHEEALGTLEELETVHGQNATIDLMRARLLTTTEGDDAAWTYLKSRWKDSDNTKLLPALIGMAKQQSPDSQDELTQAWVEAEPQNASAHLSRAEYQMANGDNRGAIEHYRQAIEQQPDNAIALNNLAWLLREQEQERALELAARAVELAPKSPAVLDTYGWILHLAGHQQKAIEQMEKALALAPDSSEIVEHLRKTKESL